MSDLAAIITASTGVLVASGGGIAFVWNKVERGLQDVKHELDKCKARELQSAATSAKQTIVIELLWQVATKNKAAAPVLARCKEHLDELKSANKIKEADND